MRTFDPWIGKDYWTKGVNGVRLLVLGESHYDKLGTEHSDYTQEVVVRWGQQKRHRFFTIVAKLVLGIPTGKYLSDNLRLDFWDCVAFYNFVQEFVGTKPGPRPTSQMWQDAHAPFLDLLDELQPQALLVLGKELSRNLPDIRNSSILKCTVKHPSRGFRYSDWQPSVEEMLLRANEMNGT